MVIPDHIKMSHSQLFSFFIKCPELIKIVSDILLKTTIRIEGRAITL